MDKSMRTRVNNIIIRAEGWDVLKGKTPNEWTDKDFLKLRNAGVKTLEAFREIYPYFTDYDIGIGGRFND